MRNLLRLLVQVLVTTGIFTGAIVLFLVLNRFGVPLAVSLAVAIGLGFLAFWRLQPGGPFADILGRVSAKAKAARRTEKMLDGLLHPAPSADPVGRLVLEAIEKRRQQDPMVGIKIGAKEINLRLMEALKDTRGVHMESLLTVLGALAGYACQAAVREAAIQAGKPPDSGFVIMRDRDGKRYFYGDPLNELLAESQYSVWGLVAGGAQYLGKPVPDVKEMFRHVTDTVGGERFGVPRIPDGHRPGDSPLNYLKGLWPKLFPVARQFCATPRELPQVFALAIQEAMTTAKDVIDPTLAVTIAMESAIPMSKVDLGAST